MEPIVYGFVFLLIYFISAGSGALIIKFLFKPPGEWIRKLLHMICVLSIFVILNVFTEWWHAGVALMFFVILVYPILSLIERFPLYGRFLSERKSGEVKSSLILVFVMMTILIVLFWGILGASWKYIILASVMAWGVGDAGAALVGKAYGRNPVRRFGVDGKKTYEGTLAMCALAWFAIAITLIVFSPLRVSVIIVIACITAPFCAWVELVSKGGTDTFTVPIGASALIFCLVQLSMILGG